METRQGPGIALPWLQSLAACKQAVAGLGKNLAAALHFLVRCRGIPTASILKKSRKDIGVGIGEIMEYGLEKLLGLTGSIYTDAERWYHRYQPTRRRLQAYRDRTWPATAPVFTVVLRLHNSSSSWLRDSLASVRAQTYSRWQLVAVADRPLPALGAILDAEAPDALVAAPVLRRAQAPMPRGDFLCFLDQGDCLEPHALHRFAEAVLRDDPDLLYSDEVRTGPNIQDIEAIEARPAFSYDHYLATPYFRNLLGLRASLVRSAGGLGDSVRAGRDVDLVLRLLERSRAVSHVADILYRRRESRLPAPPQAENAAADLAAVERHLARLGSPARVLPTDDPSCRVVCHPVAPAQRVTIIIPTKNKVELLRRCLQSLQATVPAALADICVVDHQSDEAETRAYLQALPPAIRVLHHQGVFNFSTINNHAVAQLGRSADHYLFLNNDTEALAPGWLEHMLGLAQRPEVGAVGALLLYGNRTVQHAGVQVGMHYAADHAPKGMAAYAGDGRRLPGPQGTLLAVRDQSAVTAACVLVSARAFHEVGGFDEGFAVGFGDIDLCLRLRGQGYKILIDPQAVLLHHESATRGSSGKLDPHPLDSMRFRDRWWDVILRGDPFHSPLHSRCAPYQLKSCIWNRHRLVARTVPVQLLRHGEALRPAA